MDFRVQRYAVGKLATNCYFLVNNDTKEVVVIDPGYNGDYLSEQIDTNGYKLQAILITHGHFDHIMAVNYLKEKYCCKVYIHEEEDIILDDAVRTFHVERVVPDIHLKDGQVINLAGFDIKVINTPGHSIGCVCYYIEDIKVLFSGDTLFYGSVGRTDFPTGSTAQMLDSLNNILMKLPYDVEVYPGHGQSTSIGTERMENPYIR